MADTVVDVMVALTFPEKFVIERPTYTASYGGGGGGGYDPWSLASDYGWLSVYAPFGYQYYGYYDPRYGPGYGWVPVAPPIGGGERGAGVERPRDQRRRLHAGAPARSRADAGERL